ncbi:MAG: response regulator, partial [Cyclonatronaceae bacterium]
TSAVQTTRTPENDSLSILLVDDNSINLKLAEALLKRCVAANIIIHTAENGKEAVERFQQESYALILMDIQMPVMDGFSATRRIRELEQQPARKNVPAVPIIALTAGVSHKEQNKCFDAGMDDFISKPISFDKFRNIIAKWIPERTLSFIAGKNV